MGMVKGALPRLRRARVDHGGLSWEVRFPTDELGAECAAGAAAATTSEAISSQKRMTDALLHMQAPCIKSQRTTGRALSARPFVLQAHWQLLTSALDGSDLPRLLKPQDMQSTLQHHDSFPDTRMNGSGTMFAARGDVHAGGAPDEDAHVSSKQQFQGRQSAGRSSSDGVSAGSRSSLPSRAQLRLASAQILGAHS